MNARRESSGPDLRVNVKEVLRRLSAGETAIFLDARNQEPWQSSPVKVKGAVRWTGQIDPNWPKSQWMVVY